MLMTFQSFRWHCINNQRTPVMEILSETIVKNQVGIRNIHYKCDKIFRTHLLITELKCFIQSHYHRYVKFKHLGKQYAFINICKRMGGSKELTELECGAVIGFHCCKSQFTQFLPS